MRPYLVGLILSYALCFVGWSRTFAAGACWDLGVASMGALFFWPFVAIAHAGIQLLMSLAVKAFWDWGGRHQTVVLNVPIVSVFAFAAFDARNHALHEPQVAFRHFVRDPIPNGVGITQFGRWQGIGEHMRLGLAFEIKKQDLEEVLQTGGYVPGQQVMNLDVDWLGARWASDSCGIRFDDQVARVRYVSTNDSGKHLLLRTNHPEVIFFYAKPYQ